MGRKIRKPKVQAPADSRMGKYARHLCRYGGCRNDNGLTMISGVGVFLTELDPRARVKGSRDGLGAQAVWSAMARPLIGNLTTVTDSLPGFTTLLVGLRLADRAVAEGHVEKSENAFLVWEQMTGYVRHTVYGHRGFFGLQRIVARAAKADGDGGRVYVSPQPEHQILSNQKTDGLLGNYTAPARASGLVAQGFPARLTPEAAAFVDATYLPRLEVGWGREARSLVKVLGQERVTFDLGSNGRRDSVAAVFRTPLSMPEADFYRQYLVEGGPHDSTRGRQGRLAALLEASPSGSSWPSRLYLAQLAEDAEACGWGDVADLLRRVISCESVLAPASALFSYLVGRDDARLDDVVADLRACWGERLESVDPLAASVLANQEWRDIATALEHGDYPQVVRLLANRNATVMRERGGALAWLEVTDQDRLRVRFREEPADLPAAEEIRELWWYAYFLPSLVSVLRAVEEGRS